MRAVLQRVTYASVAVDERKIAEIQKGVVILLGVGSNDSEQQVQYLVEKVVNLRIFEDEAGKMNRSLLDVEGHCLVVSQFTLYADIRKGRRPSFVDSALPEVARPLVDRFAELMRTHGIPTQTGEFGAHMLVSIMNDGPVTIWLER